MHMKMHHLIWIAAVVLLIAAIGYFNRAPILLTYFASTVPNTTLATHQDLLRDHVTFYSPGNTDEPMPALILMPGCAGFSQAHEELWAAAANEAGYLAVVVDSHGARGISREDGLKLVCNGKALLGQERAGDTLAIYAELVKRKDIDTKRIALAGWSHGGWSIMDLMTMDMKKHRPAQLLKGEAIDVPSFSSIVMFYPYCGVAAHSQTKMWTGTPPVLTFFASEDTFVNNSECAKVFAKLRKQGVEIKTKTYAGLDHSFEDPGLTEEYNHLFDEAATNDAKTRFIQFLKSH